jgi:glycosyltransferase involved in cell wall biosynthesis
MKILHVISSLEPGGAQNVALGLVRVARKHKHNAKLLCLMQSPEADLLSAKHPEYIEYPDVLFPPNLRKLPSFIKAQASLCIYLIREQPDVLHSHLFLAKVVLASNPVAWFFPIIDTVHDNLPWWGSSQWKHRCMTHFDRLYARFVARFSVAISRSVQKDLQRISELGDSKVPVIRNSIEAKYFECFAKEPSLGETRILISCRLVIDKKGLDTAVEIADRLARETVAFKLSIIGDGPDRRRL